MSSTEVSTIEELTNKEYKYGFVSDIEAESLPAGLNEDTIKKIICVGDNTSKILFNKVRVIFYCFRKRAENYSKFRKLFSKSGCNRDTIEHCINSHTGKSLLFLKRDAELLKSFP